MAVGRVSRALLVIGALAALLSCKKGVDPRRVVLHDDGALCLGVSGPDAGAKSGVELRGGEPLAISVRSACLSNGCASDRSSKCSVKRDGDRLIVTSELTWIGPEDLGQRCSRECTFLEAPCVTEVLGPGSYKVVLGARNVDVALPSHLDVRCEHDRPPPAPVAAAAGVASAIAAPLLDPSVVPAAPGTGVIAEPPPGDTICIGPANAAGKTRALKAGQPIAVTVLHRNACLGSSCTKAPAKCTLKRKGFNIVVNGQFPDPTTKPTQPCTEDCNAIAATCRSDALPSGTYTIELGAQRRTLQVPAATSPPCGP